MHEVRSLTIHFLFLVSIALIPLFIPQIVLPHADVGSVENEFNGGSILLVGDIMLGRYVETLTEEHGEKYPFERVQNLLKSTDIAFGNFEGAVPLKHEKTRDRELRLSFRQETVPLLKDVGFDVLSLANNHSLDFGTEGYENTVRICESHGMVCGGHSTNLVPSSFEQFDVGDSKVGILFLHALEIDTEDEELTSLMADMKQMTDIQLAYIHWGTEYKTIHSPEQEVLAHFLIDNGFDAIVGHHPHVIQDIELYKEKPIFYSLGNFVFDQYFDDNVQTGLGVRLEIEKSGLTYTLIPFTSIDEPSQPRLMTIDEKEAFFMSMGHATSTRELLAKGNTLHMPLTP